MWREGVFHRVILLASLLCAALAVGCVDEQGARWVIVAHPVNAVAEDGGRVAPRSVMVPDGGSVSFNITPEAGYRVSEATGCGGSLAGSVYTTGRVTRSCSVRVAFERQPVHVAVRAGEGGEVVPAGATVRPGERVRFTLVAEAGYELESASGCGGSLSGTVYTTAPVAQDCTVEARFALRTYQISATAGRGGRITPAILRVRHGEGATLLVEADAGYDVAAVSGCGGVLSGERYVVDTVTADCVVQATFRRNPPASAAVPEWAPLAVKSLRFHWTDLPDATHYRLLEDPDGVSGYAPVGDEVGVGIEVLRHHVPLHARTGSRYILQSCNEGGCSDSPAVTVSGTLAGAIGYFKAHNTGASDQFGYAVALSGDGNTLAVGAPAEDSSSTGIDGGSNDAATNSGAVYLFVRDGDGNWYQQAFIKAANTGSGDRFGYAVALSDDGNTLAVGAYLEDGGTTGPDGKGDDDSAPDAGAAYLFVRDGNGWRQVAYIKAADTGAGDRFGAAVALSADGQTLAVGAPGEDGVDDLAPDAGAVYLFTRDGGWRQQARLRAFNTEAGDRFGAAVALNRDGTVLAVGAPEEDSGATGVDGDGSDNSKSASGAVHMFVRGGGGWSQQAYLKADNTGAGDRFGHAVALDASGELLAVGAWGENSAARGVGGDGDDNSAPDSGAVYLFMRDPGGWRQQAYIKGGNSDARDRFGWSVALAGSGDALAVGARLEDSGAIGIDGDAADNGASGAGAAYFFVRRNGTWYQRSYLKASNTAAGDQFGWAVSLSGEATTLAVAGYREDSRATGIGGDAGDNSRSNAGAVYLY